MRSHRKLIVTVTGSAAVFTAALVLLLALSVAGRAGAGKEVGRADCTFLERPEEFLEAQQARRQQLQELTYSVASRLPERQEAVGPLAPRNLIDVYVFAKMQRDGIAPARLSSDTEFLRRVYLDLTGRIPSSDTVRAFLEDQSPNKRDVVIDRLVGSPEYVDRWTMFYGDLLKNVAGNTNINRYVDGRNAFYRYIRESVEANKPYHAFAGEMLIASGNSFTNGPVNYLLGYRQAMGPAQDWYDFMWVHVSQQFLGIQTTDCLLCHDGRGHLDQLSLAGSRGTRMEEWKYASFFSRINIQGTGNNSYYNLTERAAGGYNLNTTSGNRTVRQPVNGLSVVMPEYVSTAQRATNNFREALADFVTSDPQFARAAVNYLWAELMGMGIVDPPDTFDMARLEPRNPPPAPWGIQPSHPELLEALAQEFMDSGFNVQHVIKLIVQSTAYQLSSRYEGEWRDTYAPYFARKFVRRLDAEEIHDAILQATNTTASYTVQGLPQPIRWAMQFPDTNEGRGVNMLNQFLRGNRDNVPRSSEGSILQGLALFNDNFVISRVRASAANGATPNLTRSLLAASWSNQEVVDEMFLSILGRHATPQESSAAVNHFQGRTRQQAIEDLVWVLLNKVDFIFNY